MKTKLLILCSLFFALLSCKTVEYKYIPVKEVHTEEIMIRDTIVQIQLEVIKDSISSQDTISSLENKYAYSNASFSLGRLNHSLSMKEVKIPAEIQYKEIIIRDSIPYPIEITNTIIEKQKGFFWWSGAVGWFLLFALGVWKLSRVLR